MSNQWRKEREMDFTKDDAFEIAARSLERLVQLKEKKLLDDTEYQELRSLLISELKRCASSHEPTTIIQEERTPERQQVPSMPYGQLHSEIVAKIESSYKSAAGDAKQRVFRAMAEMAEKQALYPGDSAALTELVDNVFAPLSDDPLNDEKGEVSRKLLEIQRSLIEISARIRNARGASPAAKAIADTSLQSSTRAIAELSVELTRPAANRMSLSGLWGKYVLTDIKGAFEGGSAAVGIVPAFAAAFPIGLSIAAAIGVVVGAGITSGIAYAERGKVQ
jgi:hypothetical protein